LFANQIRKRLLALGRQINITWQQYIRGEVLLFAIMAVVSTVGLTILGVPGAPVLGLATGLLELLPLVGPWTAGALAVSVAYFNGTNPFGWGQLAYAGVVALMYFVLRQAEDFGRRKPAAVIAGGVVLGFAAARFLKASSSRRYASQNSEQSPVAPRF